MSEPRPSLRLANLAALKHPYSVDLYLETVCSRARFILVRLLGGIEYWRYGVEQLAALAKARGIALALIPGDRFEDARLAEASTLDGASLRLLGSYFEEGGPCNMAACLAFITRGNAPAPRAVAAFGFYEPPHPALLPLSQEKVSAKPTDEGRRNPHAPHPNPLPRRAGEGARARPHRLLPLDLPRRRPRPDRRARSRPRSARFRGNLRLRHQPQGRRRARPLERADLPRKVRHHPQRHRLFGAPRRGRRRRSRRSRRAGAAGRAGGSRSRGLGGLDARAFARRPRDACRTARDRRAHSDARNLLQAGAAARRKPAVLARRACADGRPRRLCRRSRVGLGEASTHAEGGSTARLRPLRLSRQGRPRRLCRRPRHARERRLDRRGLARRRL